jgi:hypothetical protein
MTFLALKFVAMVLYYVRGYFITSDYQLYVLLHEDAGQIVNSFITILTHT